VTDFPDIPPLQDVNTQPPDRSSYVEIQRVKRSLVLLATNFTNKYDIFDEPNKQLQNSSSYLVRYLDGNGPPEYDLVLRQFWRPVGSSYHRIPAGNTVTIVVSKTQGIDKTVSQSISTSLGIGEDGLGADVEATFSTSVTTSEEQSFKEKIQVDAPADGNVRVWLLWQRVHEIVAMLPDGTQLQKYDPDRPAEAVGPWEGASHVHNGALVNYIDTSWLFPSDIFVPYQKDFPASSAIGNLE
jgi:hypothetical protein